MSRLDESEDPDVLGDPRDCAEPRLSDGEDVDSLGDDVENANGTVVADETDRDVKAVQSQRRNLLFCPGLCDDVFTGRSYRRQFVTAIFKAKNWLKTLT